MDDPITHVTAHLERSRAVLAQAAASPELARTLAEIARCIANSFRAGHKLLVAGNGGSAADAQHIAAEFLSRFRLDRTPLPAVALTTDTSVLTAVGNDYGFDQVFARQVQGLGRAGDVFLAISTSGRSPNVLLALTAARERGLTCVGFTGTRGAALQEACDLCVVAPSDDTALIQQVHLVAAHAICGLVEQALFGSANHV